MPFRQFADAGAQSTCASPITNSQTSVTLASASGFPALVANGQLSVLIWDSGSLSYVAGASPFTVNNEYQPVNNISGNVITFGSGGGAASRAAYAGTTPKSYSAGATIAVVMLAEDIIASSTWKCDEQNPTSGSSITIPSSGTFPTSYLGIPYRHIEIEYTVRTTSGNGADLLQLQFNGDTGSNYDYDVAGFAGTAYATPAQGLGGTFIRVGAVPGGGTAAGIANKGFIEIIDAFEAIWRKHVGSRCYRNDASAFGTDWTNGDWHPATPQAITSVTLALSAGAFAASGCRITTRLKP